MSINIISCVVNHKNNLAIGRNGSLLVHLVDDLKNIREKYVTESELKFVKNKNMNRPVK